MRRLSSLAVAAFAGLVGACSSPAISPPKTAVASASAAPAAPTVLTFEVAPPDSNIDAIATSVLGTHVVHIERFHGVVSVVPSRPAESHVTLDVDMTSLTMSTETLTRAVRSRRFFDVKKYPTGTFVSSVVERTANGDFRVTGLLTMHGASKVVTFDATLASGPSWATARGDLHLNRHDFGLTDDGIADHLMGDEIIVRVWAQGTLTTASNTAGN